MCFAQLVVVVVVMVVPAVVHVEMVVVQYFAHACLLAFEVAVVDAGYKEEVVYVVLVFVLRLSYVCLR